MIRIMDAAATKHNTTSRFITKDQVASINGRRKNLIFRKDQVHEVPDEQGYRFARNYPSVKVITDKGVDLSQKDDLDAMKMNPILILGSEYGIHVSGVKKEVIKKKIREARANGVKRVPKDKK